MCQSSTTSESKYSDAVIGSLHAIVPVKFIKNFVLKHNGFEEDVKQKIKIVDIRHSFFWDIV